MRNGVLLQFCVILFRVSVNIFLRSVPYEYTRLVSGHHDNLGCVKILKYDIKLDQTCQQDLQDSRDHYEKKIFSTLTCTMS